MPDSVNTLRLRQDGRYLTDYIFKRIFLNENVKISIDISQNFVPNGPINNIPALVQIMAWHWPGAKPLSESLMVSLLKDIAWRRPGHEPLSESMMVSLLTNMCRSALMS